LEIGIGDEIEKNKKLKQKKKDYEDLYTRAESLVNKINDNKT
jgi:hypothetical protein